MPLVEYGSSVLEGTLNWNERLSCAFYNGDLESARAFNIDVAQRLVDHLSHG